MTEHQQQKYDRDLLSLNALQERVKTTERDIANIWAKTNDAREQCDDHRVAIERFEVRFENMEKTQDQHAALLKAHAELLNTVVSRDKVDDKRNEWIGIFVMAVISIAGSVATAFIIALFK
jgi:chromosome segregation ATPase